MSQQIQELIQKLQREGVQEAESKSRLIEEQARKKAEDMIAKAKSQSEQIISAAQAESRKLLDSTHTALKQASRDVLLNLRKEIEATLQRVILQEIQKTLTAENLVDIIRETILNYVKNLESGQEVTVTIADRDFKKVKDALLAELKSKLKTSVTLKSSNELSGGFTISFDSGKSFYDFSDSSLAQYLAGFLNAEVASLIQESTKS